MRQGYSGLELDEILPEIPPSRGGSDEETLEAINSSDDTVPPASLQERLPNTVETEPFPV